MNKNKMNERKLMRVFDVSYNETLSPILRIVPDEQDAKNLLGRIYKETWNRLSANETKQENTQVAFERTKRKYGLLIS
jgi:hypothetical protein